MTREEFAVLVKGMKAIYTQESFIPDQDAFNMWFALLQDLPYSLANKSVMKYMMTAKFPPTPADIRGCASEYTERELGELEAWAIVRKAIQNSAYKADEEFNKLPDLCRAAVGSPENLRHWGMTDSEQVSTVIQSNFTRAYRSVLERQKENSKLPPNMRELIKVARADKKLTEKRSGYDSLIEKAVPAPPEIEEFLRLKAKGDIYGLGERNQGREEAPEGKMESTA